MATQHYAYTLLKKFGMLPWRRVVETTRENMSRAALHHNRVLLKCCFHPWLEFTRRVNEERLEAAEALCKNILLRRTWRQWRKVRAASLSLDCSQYLIFPWLCKVRKSISDGPDVGFGWRAQAKEGTKFFPLLRPCCTRSKQSKASTGILPIRFSGWITEIRLQSIGEMGDHLKGGLLYSRLTVTLLILSPRYYGHLFCPGETPILLLIRKPRECGYQTV